jgi:hypothetical protein
MAAAPWLTHCSSPQLCTICGWRLEVALAQRRGDRHRVAGAHRVLEAELDRLHAQRVGDLFHQAFQGELGLRRAVAAERARRRDVGVDDLGGELHVRAAIGRQPAQTR